MNTFNVKYFSISILIFIYSCDRKVNTFKKSERPNIILIMSDDMGYSDIAPYGGEIDTPNLSNLAKKSLKFTQFYNNARCSATRASLLTGTYPHQAGIGHHTNPPSDINEHNYGTPEYSGKLSSNVVTIAEVLKESGYSTIMSGKWHLSSFDKNQWPSQRGFENFYGTIAGACNYFKPEAPRSIFEGNQKLNIDDENYYTTDAFTDKAIQYIDKVKSENSEKPFFLYLSYNAPHWPLHAPKGDIDKYRGKYLNGWENLRKERYTRMIEMGLIYSSWDLSYDDIVSWNSLSEEKRREMDLRMAIYSAMIDRMDQNIGRLLESLKKKNIFENTIIMFLNDNGACAEFDMLGSGPKEQLETKKGPLKLSYGKAWANASNTPFRSYKHWTHEGGIGTPFIVHWPNGISKNLEGSTIDQYGFLLDIMATCLDLAKTIIPEVFNGNKIKKHSGKSLTPIFKGSKEQIHKEPIFWEHEGNKAVRMGDYKLVQDWDKGIDDNWELYNISRDRTEQNNLIDSLPDKSREMISMYNDWARKIGVIRWDDIQQLRKDR